MAASHERQAGADLVFAGALLRSPDPERLLAFYQTVFGGECLGASQWRTPGYVDGPVLTIEPGPQGRALRANEPGYAHLCFEADDVGGLLHRLLAQGGQLVSTLPAPQRQPGVYASDPDGNLIEVHLPFPARMTPWDVLRTLATLLRIKAGWARPGRVRFIHVNVVVPDWQAAVDFYTQGLGAVPTGRLRDYRGPYLGQLVGIPGATVAGRHVALPGYGAGGPTFEVFTYHHGPGARGDGSMGIARTEFLAHDVDVACARLLQAGAVRLPDAAEGCVVLQDPWGNSIGLRPLGG